MPVSWSMTASVRCWMSERINGVERTATHSTSASGASTSSGACTTAWGSTPKATAITSAAAITTPATTPRVEKRALSVMSGMAIHESAGMPRAPASATAPAIVSSLPIQAVNITSSGRATRGSRRSAVAKNAAEGTMNSSGHQPVQAAEARIATPRIANVRWR
jgi:hypothetical protein